MKGRLRVVAAVGSLFFVAGSVPVTAEKDYPPAVTVEAMAMDSRAERSRRVARQEIPAVPARTIGAQRKVTKVSAIETAVQYALAQVGKPYLWAKPLRSPTQPRVIVTDGYDCSGLTWAAFRAAGIDIGYVTYTQIRNGVPVSRNQLQRGDLVFPDPGHVQIYLGDGKVVESPTFGKKVQVGNVYAFYAARRLGESDSNGAGNAGSVGVPSGNGGSGFTESIKWLTDSHNWLRLYMILFGAALLASVIVPLIQQTGLKEVAKYA